MMKKCLGLALFFSINASAQDTTAEQILRSRNSEFAQEIVQVADNVYTAVGFTPANVSMIVGDDGIILVDTGMSPPHAMAVNQAFREITDLPVKGIIYTHGHGDHTGGASVFVSNANPEIWAMSNYGAEDLPLSEAGLTIQRQRGIRQAGFALPDQLRINNGIAPAMRPLPGGPGNMPGGNAFSAGGVSGNGDMNAADTFPNNTFAAGRQNIEIAGINLALVAAPGETADQLYVWYPDKEVLFAGDNYYKSFPNLYAIRGTPYRDVAAWANSLDLMIEENPAAVVPGHTSPVLGKAQSVLALQNHRDAIRYVHDKTVEGMNLGMRIDELVEYVQLPQPLASNPDLGEYYGKVSWAVRSIFNGYLGWYDGNPSNLSPLSPIDEAENIALLAGGIDQLQHQAQTALDEGQSQWAAQLADYLLVLDENNTAVKLIKADALTKLARESTSALARNYYLTIAQQLRMEVQ